MCNCHERISVINHPTDGITLFTLSPADGHLFERRYIGYTYTEARAQFTAELHAQVTR